MSRKGSTLPRPSSDETSVNHEPAQAWAELFGCPAPGRMDRLVAQAVAWQRQMLVHGDVVPAIARDLALISAQAEAQRTVDGAHPVRADAVRTADSATSHEPDISAADTVAQQPEVATAQAAGASRTIAAPGRSSLAPATAIRRPCPKPLPPASSQLLIGARLVKTHGGQTHVVEVTADGMLYEGEMFTSLSAVARHITGTHWNGLLFFGLRRRKIYPPKAASHG